MRSRQNRNLTQMGPVMKNTLEGLPGRQLDQNLSDLQVPADVLNTVQQANGRRSQLQTKECTYTAESPSNSPVKQDETRE